MKVVRKVKYNFAGKKEMTSRERILKALKGEKVDRIPWVPLCSRTFFLSLPEYKKRFPLKWWEKNEGLSEDLREEELRFRVNFYRKIGADFIQWGGGDACKIERPNIKAERKQKNNNLFIKYKTPIGELSEELVFTRESHTLYRKNYLLKGTQDFSIYKYLIKDTVFTSCNEKAQRLLDIIGESGVIFSTTADPPLQDWICSLLGTEGTIFGLFDHKKEIEELIELQHKKNLEYCKILAKSPLKIFLHQASWNIGRISPKIYKKYYSPYLKKYNGILHQRNKICLDHISGERLKPYISLIEGINLDGLCGFVFPPRHGDLKLSDICARWEEKMIVIGGLDSDFLARAKVEEVKEKTKQILDEIGSAKNFILGAADDIVYGTPIENLEAVSIAIQEYGES